MQTLNLADDFLQRLAAANQPGDVAAQCFKTRKRLQFIVSLAQRDFGQFAPPNLLGQFEGAQFQRAIFFAQLARETIRPQMCAHAAEDFLGPKRFDDIIHAARAKSLHGAFSVVSRAVRKMTGISRVASFSFSRRHAVKPSNSGIRISSRIKSGSALAATFNAATPFWAVKIS